MMLWSCYRNVKITEKPSMPIIYFDFKGEIKNTGLWGINLRGIENVSYVAGITDSCLNLSSTSSSRKPIIIEKSPDVSVSDYQGITFMLWTKAAPFDPNEYTIIGQKDYSEEFGAQGWAIGKSASGSWNWWYSDGASTINYNPTLQRQSINDEDWHFIGFSVDYQQKEARLYYDGQNIATICLDNLDNSMLVETPFFIGCDPLSTELLADVYNGMIDDLGVWSRVLSSDQISSMYQQYKKLQFKEIRKMPKTLTFMSWNINLGGRKDGRYVGVQRVAEVIKESGADVISLQEVYGSGEMIADALGYYYYRRNQGLSVLSRFPLGKTYNILRTGNSGVVTIELPKNNQLIFCPVWLNYLPNQRAYISSGHADADTIISRELETRGAEMRYILWDIQTLLDKNDAVPLVMAGDFISGSHLDWTEANKANYFGLVVDFPVSLSIQNAGLIDSYREIYPDETANRGVTYPLNLTTSFKDRTDIIYYSGNKLKLKSSSVINYHPYQFPSDHGAVISSFEWDD